MSLSFPSFRQSVCCSCSIIWSNFLLLLLHFLSAFALVWCSAVFFFFNQFRITLWLVLLHFISCSPLLTWFSSFFSAFLVSLCCFSLSPPYIHFLKNVSYFSSLHLISCFKKNCFIFFTYLLDFFPIISRLAFSSSSQRFTNLKGDFFSFFPVFFFIICAASLFSCLRSDYSYEHNLRKLARFSSLHHSAIR